MTDHNKYRFVHFTARLTMRVPWGTDPDDAYEAFREQFLAIPDPEAPHGWEVVRTTLARGTAYPT